MSTHTSLFDLTQQLLHDDGARAAFAEDPQAFLVDHGVGDLTPAEVGEGLGFVADTLPPSLAVQLPNVWAPEGATDGSSLTGFDGVVEQFQTVADVDPALVLEPADDSDPDADAAYDADPLDALDALDALDLAPPPAAPLAEEADHGAADGSPGDGDVSMQAEDGGFGTGDGGTPDDATARPQDVEALEMDAEHGVSVPPPDFSYSDDPTFDFSGEDSFTPPAVPDETTEGDELDSDNGDWDGSWDDQQGHHLF